MFDCHQKGQFTVYIEGKFVTITMEELSQAVLNQADALPENQQSAYLGGWKRALYQAHNRVCGKIAVNRDKKKNETVRATV